jgi:hypothetical protein
MRLNLRLLCVSQLPSQLTRLGKAVYQTRKATRRVRLGEARDDRPDQAPCFLRVDTPPPHRIEQAAHRLLFHAAHAATASSAARTSAAARSRSRSLTHSAHRAGLRVVAPQPWQRFSALTVAARAAMRRRSHHSRFAPQ